MGEASAVPGLADAASAVARWCAGGTITSRLLAAAVMGTPRQGFVPGAAAWPEVLYGDAGAGGWADEAPTTAASGAPGWPASAEVAPAVMTVAALEEFGLDWFGPDDWILLADIGDGWAAALLAFALGTTPGRVTCVVAGTATARQAAERVRASAHVPVLVDGQDPPGVPTGGWAAILGGWVSAVPAEWIRGLAPQGRIVAWWNSAALTSRVVLTLHVPGVVAGPVRPTPEADYWAPIVGHRPAPPDRPAVTAAPLRGRGRCGRPGSEIDPRHLGDPGLVMLLALVDPTLQRPTSSGGSWLVVATDGSFVELTAAGGDGGAGAVQAGCRVVQGGPRPLLSTIEQAAHAWVAADRPGADEYGLTVEARSGVVTVWAGTPSSAVLVVPARPEPTGSPDRRGSSR